MHDCLKDTKPMSSEYTNKDGWEESKIRRYLNEEVIKLLPDDLQKMIKPTKIVQVWDGKRRETEDKLFLLSKTQVFGKNKYYETIEPNDSQIDIFKRKELEGRRVPTIWWLRSPYFGDSTNFCYVYTDGTVSYYFAHDSLGVAPAFCI